MSLDRRTGRARSFDVACTIEIEHTAEHLHAHVDLDGDVAIGPGDRITVQGPKIDVPFGGRARLRRMALVERAGPLTRAWTRLRAEMQVTEFIDINFSSEKTS